MIDASDSTVMGGKSEDKHTKLEGEESRQDRSKFKKFEMPDFEGTDPDQWLFQAKQYFQIHKLTESEKMTLAVISFDRPALNWYRSHADREPFAKWEDLRRGFLFDFDQGMRVQFWGDF